MSIQFSLQLSDKPDAQPNDCGVLCPGQPGVWYERVGLKNNRQVYAEIIVAHREGLYYFGYGLLVIDSGRFGMPSLRGKAFTTCYGARDAAINLIEECFHSRDLCQTVNGERGTTVKHKAAFALKELFHKEIVGWHSDQDFVDMTDRISTDRMREDGKLWMGEEAA